MDERPRRESDEEAAYSGANPALAEDRVPASQPATGATIRPFTPIRPPSAMRAMSTGGVFPLSQFLKPPTTARLFDPCILDPRSDLLLGISPETQFNGTVSRAR